MIACVMRYRSYVVRKSEMRNGSKASLFCQRG